MNIATLGIASNKVKTKYDEKIEQCNTMAMIFINISRCKF